MNRDIEWTEKLERRVKRTVRVKFPGGDQLKWQIKRSDEERWDYDSPLTSDDWERLEEKVTAMLNRRRATYEDVDLVKKYRRKFDTR